MVQQRLCALILAALGYVLLGLPVYADQASPAQWPSYGRTLAGTRFTPADGITPANVGHLSVAWTYHTGEDPTKEPDPRNLPAFEATPLKIADTLYLCTPRNQVIALDAERGTERWRFDPKAVVKGTFLLACRGVSYYESPKPLPQCQKRILIGTIDARLIALDAASGVPCSDFGKGGTVDLTENIGKVEAGFYGVTSPPTIARGLAIVGALVLDDQSIDVPSGVVRAFDPVSGALRWSFDMGNADPNAKPKPGETYTRGSPNAWSVYSADEALGLVYIPTGNNSPDYFGANRNATAEKYASAVVALDIETGVPRWTFQTVHHDLWDYDVPAQPVLVDLDTPQGKVPALIQTTKRGEIFVLDRRTGAPLSRVEERPVPGAAAKGDTVSPTQPFSVDMPSLAGPILTEASMWGVTPFDLLSCRTQFKTLRYEGPFTPPSVQGSIHFPSNMGGSNWGSVSFDEDRQILIANTSEVPAIVRLIPRDQVAAEKARGVRIHNTQTGTPYAALQTPMLSPLGIPCNAPPWGRLTAIDLKTKRVIWQRPLGTTEDRAPFNISLALGMPNSGGALVTRSGLVFIGAAIDSYLRAFDIKTGKEVWKAKLPASAQATPMSFVSESDGRQYIVIAAGGHKVLSSKLGDSVIAFALPKPR